MFRFLCMAVMLASSTGSPAGGQGPRWKYVDDPDETTWAPLCRNGTHQSPINIVTTKVDRLNSQQLVYHNYDSVLLMGENDGRSINFYPNFHLSKVLVNKDLPSINQDLPSTNQDLPSINQDLQSTNQELPSINLTEKLAQITGGPCKHVYILDSLHFHWPSEHTINCKRFPLEIHYVHRRSDLSMEKAMACSDGLAVVAVLADIDPENERECSLKDFEEDVRDLCAADSSVSLRNYNLINMMSSNPGSYYTYPGSLTTPGCAESVIWIVQKEPIFTTQNQIQDFKNADLHRGYGCNSRAVKPTNGRPVLSSD